MNQQEEFMNEAFHTLAQPIMALRAAVELGIGKEVTGPAAHQLFEDCLGLIDRLMQDLAVFREIASIDEQLALHSCDLQALLQNSVEEIAPLAEANGVALQLNAQPFPIECNETMFRRAIFVLFDEMIARVQDGEISISMESCQDGVRLELHPGIPPGQRRKLCHKLMQSAGGSDIGFTSACTSITFPKCRYQPVSAMSSTDERLLT